MDARRGRPRWPGQCTRGERQLALREWLFLARRRRRAKAVAGTSVRWSIRRSASSRPERSTQRGGAPANNLARIDANGIHALGSGGSNGVDPFGYVSTVAVYGTDVFVGGTFSTVGGKISANVGRFATDEVFANGFE